MFKLLVLIKEAFLLSFATASSEAAYPKILDALDRFGVKRKISSFVMPMGYSFNLDGSMMYCTFAVLFIAQAYGIELSIGTQITMLLILMLTSKGMAGVPRASLVVIAATLNQFNIPEAGLLLILGVDTFLDMGRSATNAVGNSIATAVVAKWEGELLPEARGRGQCPARTRRRRRPRTAARTRAMATRECLRHEPARRLHAGGLLAACCRSPRGRNWPDAHAAPSRRRRRAHRHAGQGARQRHHHARLSRIVDPVLLPVAAQRADRLLDRAVQACWSGAIERGGRQELAIQLGAGDGRVAHRGGGLAARSTWSAARPPTTSSARSASAFSPTIFVSGTKLMVKRGSPMRSFRDLAGKRVAVTAGTTNEKTLRDLNAEVQARHDARRVARPRAVLRAGGRGPGRCLRDRRRAALRPDRAERGPRRDYMVHGRLPVVRPLRHHVPQGRPQLARWCNDAFQIAGRGRRDRAPVQALVPAQAALGRPASTCR